MNLNMDPDEWLEAYNKHLESITDIKEKALHCIEFLCIAVEDGADPKKCLEEIYKLAHATTRWDQGCSHDDWIKDIEDSYKKYILDNRF